jgi:hypothetical protein
MDDLPFMRAVDGGADRGHDSQLGGALLSMRRRPPIQRQSFHQFHGKKWDGRAMGLLLQAGIKDSDDARVLEPSERLDFGEES